MSWKNPPTNFALQILKDGDDHLRRVSTEMLQGVIVRSPVDSGAFRSNHRVSVNGADNGYDVSQQDKSGTTALSDGSVKILQAKMGDKVYIQNNLPYAVRLENGWSQQAPSGIYALTFLSISSKYK